MMFLLKNSRYSLVLFLVFSMISASMLSATGNVHAATGPGGLNYSGGLTWNSSTGTLTFTGTGSIQGFYYDVPTTVKKVVIKSNVTVTGAFKFYGNATIEGENQNTSVIYGTPEQKYTQNRGLNPWEHNAIALMSNATLNVKNLKTLNPRGYHISGYGSATVIHADRVSLIDDRGGDQNNSDGFIGSNGSSIKNSFIKTGDDSIKLYRNMTIENVEIHMLRNGAPIQFGWNDDDNQNVTATITGLKVVGKSPNNYYNLAVFTWLNNNNTSTKNITISDVDIQVPGAKLFQLNPSGGTANITMTGATIQTGTYGVKNTKGTISINGSTQQKNNY
ncbi:hypothetical protein JJQ72_05225 [Paenibacillus sp. F411]|uniref:Uncharacterized protein n=1 Tax=Paenibacillus algicola TaxID=2565926 RepID=A0A4V1G3Q8_9BACL|nr:MULTISPECIES: hypothetical protein [Paenibacillus]MBO2943384.1 hypothetical protein [Paenibacillus sp. F411]QCT02044.1 hypothetical protein E6C60_1328 [Paenibacillus algicola]